MLGVLGMFLASLALVPLIGSEFFPNSDESQFRITLRAPIGTRVEETEKMVARIEEMVRQNLQPGELKSIVSTVGIPGRAVGPLQREHRPARRAGAGVPRHAGPAEAERRADRQRDPAALQPASSRAPLTYFNLGGIISRVLNRGSQNPLEVEVLGYDLDDAPGVAAREVARVMRDVPGVADVQISREGNYPQFSVVVDREKAATAGLSQRDVAQAALFSLNSNVSVNPSIFTDPRSGNQYNIVVQLDEPFRVRPEDLGKIFVTAPAGRPIVLSTLADIRRSVAPVEIERKYQQRLIRVSGNPVGPRPRGHLGRHRAASRDASRCRPASRSRWAARRRSSARRSPA